MKIIKEKLIGTYVFSIDEATVKGDYRGDIWFSTTPDINIGDETMHLSFDRAKIELLFSEYDYHEPAFAGEYGEYCFKEPVKIGDIQTGVTEEKIPYAQFLDDKGNTVFKIVFVFSFTSQSTYCVDFLLSFSRELQDEKYHILSDVLTNDPSRELKYIRCKDCGKLFALTRMEVDWFSRKNLHLPKRCEDCRKKRNT